jgi:hypothetical protein
VGAGVSYTPGVGAGVIDSVGKGVNGEGVSRIMSGVGASVLFVPACTTDDVIRA